MTGARVYVAASAFFAAISLIAVVVAVAKPQVRVVAAVGAMAGLVVAGTLAYMAYQAARPATQSAAVAVGAGASTGDGKKGDAATNPKDGINTDLKDDVVDGPDIIIVGPKEPPPSDPECVIMGVNACAGNVVISSVAHGGTLHADCSIPGQSMAHGCFTWEV
jgi:hypothetical protein